MIIIIITIRNEYFFRHISTGVRNTENPHLRSRNLTNLFQLKCVLIISKLFGVMGRNRNAVHKLPQFDLMEAFTRHTAIRAPFSQMISLTLLIQNQNTQTMEISSCWDVMWMLIIYTKRCTSSPNLRKVQLFPEARHHRGVQSGPVEESDRQTSHHMTLCGHTWHMAQREPGSTPLDEHRLHQAVAQQLEPRGCKTWNDAEVKLTLIFFCSDDIGNVAKTLYLLWHLLNKIFEQKSLRVNLSTKTVWTLSVWCSSHFGPGQTPYPQLKIHFKNKLVIKKAKEDKIDQLRLNK